MSIFDLCPPAADGEKLAYFNFQNIGDAIEGTLVNRKRDLAGKFGKQDAFGIKTATGEVFYVSAKHASAGFFGQMDKLQLGQIIGLKYTKDIPTSYGNPYKFIHLAQDPSIVDVKWMNEREAQKASMMSDLNSGMVAPVAAAPVATTTVESQGVTVTMPVDMFPTAPAPTYVAPTTAPVAPAPLPTIEIPVMDAAPVLNDQQKVMKIAQVIRDRYQLTAGEEIKAKVTELTTLQMVPANLDAIIAALG